MATQTTAKAWEYKPLKEVADFKIGRTPPRNDKKYWNEATYPWVAISDMSPFGLVTDTKEKVSEEAHQKIFRKKLIPSGSILMSFKLTIGRTAKLGIDAYHNEAIVSFSTKDGLDSDFLFYYLPTINFHNHQDTAVKGKTLNKQKIEKLPIPIPRLSEQKKIAKVLTTIQAAITEQEYLIEKLKELKRSMMQHLFTHGTTGEIAKMTHIGEIPESWQLKKIGDLVKVSSGGTPSREVTSYWHDGTIPWVKTTEINYGLINATDEKITEAGFKNSSAKYFPAGTLLMAMYGQGVTRGRVAILNIDATTNQACAAFLGSKLINRYLFHYLTFTYDKVRQLGHGANQKNLNASLIKAIDIPVGDPKEMQAIISALDIVEAKCSATQEKIKTHQQLFKTLLHELMSGERRVTV